MLEIGLLGTLRGHCSEECSPAGHCKSNFFSFFRFYFFSLFFQSVQWFAAGPPPYLYLIDKEHILLGANENHSLAARRLYRPVSAGRSQTAPGLGLSINCRSQIQTLNPATPRSWHRSDTARLETNPKRGRPGSDRATAGRSIGILEFQLEPGTRNREGFFFFLIFSIIHPRTSRDPAMPGLPAVCADSTAHLSENHRAPASLSFWESSHDGPLVGCQNGHVQIGCGAPVAGPVWTAVRPPPSLVARRRQVRPCIVRGWSARILSLVTTCRSGKPAQSVAHLESRPSTSRKWPARWPASPPSSHRLGRLPPRADGPQDTTWG